MQTGGEGIESTHAAMSWPLQTMCVRHFPPKTPRQLSVDTPCRCFMSIQNAPASLPVILFYSGQSQRIRCYPIQSGMLFPRVSCLTVCGAFPLQKVRTYARRCEQDFACTRSVTTYLRRP